MPIFVILVKAVVRRSSGHVSEAPKEPEILVYKTLKIYLKQKKVTINDESIQVTKKEFEILSLFIKNQNQVFSREDILTKVWKGDVYVLDRTIDVNITRLRKKIGVYGKQIVTLHVIMVALPVANIPVIM